jgi:transaldolase
MTSIAPSLAAHGIDLERIAAQLERDGVRAFEDSYERLLAAIDERSRVVAENAPAEIAA